MTFSYSPCIQRPHYWSSHRNIAIPFGVEKLEWWGYPMVKRDMCKSFRHNTGMWQTDGQTDILPRHSPRYAYMSRGKNPLLNSLLYLLMSWVWWNWPLTCLTNHCPSVLWHSWLGRVTHEIVQEMAYNIIFYYFFHPIFSPLHILDWNKNTHCGWVYWGRAILSWRKFASLSLLNTRRLRTWIIFFSYAFQEP